MSAMRNPLRNASERHFHTRKPKVIKTHLPAIGKQRPNQFQISPTGQRSFKGKIFTPLDILPDFSQKQTACRNSLAFG